MSLDSVLWLLLLLTATSDSSLHVNTLLFSTGAPYYHLRNCSCPVVISNCDEALANSMCCCRTVLRSSLPPADLRESGPLTVWVKEGWELKELLDGSTVLHLLLCSCGAEPLDGQYISLLGLRTLRVYNMAPLVLHPQQEVIVSPPERLLTRLDALWTAQDPLTVLDLSVLNGLSTLKAFRIPAEPQQLHHLRHLRLPSAQLAGPQRVLITFIY